MATATQPKKRGGRRPGAGAPKGNVNTLRIAIITLDPPARALLRKLVAQFPQPDPTKKPRPKMGPLDRALKERKPRPIKRSAPAVA
jgi:hypothetical protein